MRDSYKRSTASSHKQHSLAGEYNHQMHQKQCSGNVYIQLVANLPSAVSIRIRPQPFRSYIQAYHNFAAKTVVGKIHDQHSGWNMSEKASFRNPKTVLDLWGPQPSVYWLSNKWDTWKYKLILSRLKCFVSLSGWVSRRVLSASCQLSICKAAIFNTYAKIAMDVFASQDFSENSTNQVPVPLRTGAFELLE